MDGFFDLKPLIRPLRQNAAGFKYLSLLIKGARRSEVLGVTRDIGNSCFAEPSIYIYRLLQKEF